MGVVFYLSPYQPASAKPLPAGRENVPYEQGPRKENKHAEAPEKSRFIKILIHWQCLVALRRCKENRVKKNGCAVGVAECRPGIMVFGPEAVADSFVVLCG